MRQILATVVFSILSGIAAGAERPAQHTVSSFKAEIEGKVALGVDGAGREVVRVVPENGLPVRIAGAAAPEWRARAGYWVEIEGQVMQGAEEAEMEVWELSLERHPFHPGEPPVECNGILEVSGNDAVLRTRAGEIPLVGSVNRSYGSGYKVEVKGSLVAEGGRLAVSVAWMEHD